jgi:hypothetical protein
MEDEGSAGATVENTQEPMAGEAGIPDLSEGVWAKNFNGWAMEVSPAGIGFIRICKGRPNEVYRRVSPAAAAVYAAAISQGFEPPRALRDQDKPAG